MGTSGTSVGKILSGFCFGAPSGTVIVGLGNFFVTLRRLPGAIPSAYRALWGMKKIGPVLKKTVSIVGPLGIIVIPCVVTLGSAIYGLGLGFYRGAGLGRKDEGGVLAAWSDSWESVKSFDEALVVPALVELKGYVSDPLPEGEKPFDISYLQGLRGLASAVLLGPFEALGLTAVTYRWLPRAVYEVYRGLWKLRASGFTMKVLKIAVGGLIVPVVILLIGITPPAAFLFGLGDICREGYRYGFVASSKNVLSRVKEYYTVLKREAAKVIKARDS